MQVNQGWEKIQVTLLTTQQEIESQFGRVFDILKMTWRHLQNQIYDPHNGEHNLLIIDALEGRALPTALETVSLQFDIRNVSRTCSHQIVRGRVGWFYNQESQMPQSIADHGINIPLHMLADEELKNAIDDLAKHSESVYRLALAKQIPFQSARYVALEGCTTSLVAGCTFPAFRGACNSRLCFSTNDEINIVFRKMIKELERVHPLLAKYLNQPCDRTGICGLQDPVFPCCGKYPHKYKDTHSHMFENGQNNFQRELARHPELQMYNDELIVNAMAKAHEINASRDVERPAAD